MLWIINGKVFTMDQNRVIENGSVAVSKTKIVYVGQESNIQKGDEVIDAKGCIVMPGMIDAHCHVGITEEKMGVEGDDCNEATNPITPYMRAIDAVNPMDAAFHCAIAAGITSVMTGPGSANVVCGQSVFLKTHGRCIDEMIVKNPAAMKIAFGENPKNQYGTNGDTPSTRMGIAGLLREELTKASQYCQKRKNGQKTEPDFRWECWMPVFHKKIPLKAHCHRSDDILTAIRIAKEFQLDMTLDHCTEGHLIADKIKESGFPVICGPYFASRNKIEIKNLDFKTPGVLAHEGICCAIMTDHPVSLIQYLPLCAGLAVKKGMSYEDALLAVTANAAKICGVDDRVGSLKEGMDADIVIFDQNPLSLEANVRLTMIDGKVVYERKEGNETP